MKNCTLCAKCLHHFMFPLAMYKGYKFFILSQSFVHLLLSIFYFIGIIWGVIKNYNEHLIFCKFITVEDTLLLIPLNSTSHWTYLSYYSCHFLEQFWKFSFISFLCYLVSWIHSKHLPFMRKGFFYKKKVTRCQIQGTR